MATRTFLPFRCQFQTLNSRVKVAGFFRGPTLAATLCVLNLSGRMVGSLLSHVNRK